MKMLSIAAQKVLSAAESLKSVTYRHRNKFYALGAVTAGSWLIGKYVAWKMEDLTKEMGLEHTATKNLKERFQQNQQDCNFLVMSLMPTLGERLFEELNIEKMIGDLQNVKDKNEKMALWEEIKIASFTRTISAAYLTTLLTLFTQIQLNLLGRSIYLNSTRVFSQVAQEETLKGHIPLNGDVISAETERAYLSFSWFLLNVGWKRCVERVRTAVEKELEHISLRERTNWDSYCTLLDKIRQNIEYDNKEWIWSFKDCLLPKEGEEFIVFQEDSEQVTRTKVKMTPELQKLLDETRDLLESDDFDNVALDSFKAVIDVHLQHVEPLYFDEELDVVKSETAKPVSQVKDLSTGTDASQQDAESQDEAHILQSKEVPLVTLLPGVSKLAHRVIHGTPNLYLRAIGDTKSVRAFSMIVYTGWD